MEMEISRIVPEDEQGCEAARVRKLLSSYCIRLTKDGASLKKVQGTRKDQ